MMPRAAFAERPLREVRLGPCAVEYQYGMDGCMRLRSAYPLGPYPARITEKLEYWADKTPDRVFLAKRTESGGWRKVTWGETLRLVRNIAQSILDRNLSAERPIAILSGNDIEHALLGLAAMYAGVPYAPISPAYSLVSRDFDRLRHIFARLTPGLVFAADGFAYEPALECVVPKDAEIVVTRRPPARREANFFDQLATAHATSAVDDAHARVDKETTAKILFTSGSTGRPKGVINTQRMLTSNQEALRTVFAFLADEPPVLCDWLPWNHTFGGNHNLGIALYNGGSFYIDDGRPMPGEVDITIRNLREIAPTVYFNVPKGFEELIGPLRSDAALRERFFSRVRMLFYAGAGLSQHVWDALEDIALEACGERILMMTGLGATETAPFALCAHPAIAGPGVVGLPVPGVELKLAPVESKLEARVRGPGITPGYWREPELTRAAFDRDGFYRFGDALRFVDPRSPARGFVFDGRIAEDFKLATGAWVSVGPLRAKFIAHGVPFVRDVVIAGHDRGEVGALVFPNLEACAALCPANGVRTAASILADPAVRMTFQLLLDGLAAARTGTSTCIARALLVDEEPSIDAGELTDKGSVNQRAILSNRGELVAELYADPPSPRIIRIAENSSLLYVSKTGHETNTTALSRRPCRQPAASRRAGRGPAYAPTRRDPS